jgi:glycosyltransferase involved in cell wall biosynthesis
LGQPLYKLIDKLVVSSAERGMEHFPLVIIPPLNEEKTIAAVINGVKELLPGAEVVVVDDGSADKTSALARACGARVLRHPFNLGAGAALQTGFKYALAGNFSCLITFDGDGQHKPEYIKPLIDELARGDYDMVIGSRFLSDTRYRPSFFRRLGMRFFRALTSLALAKKITDPTSGFRAMKQKLVQVLAKDIYPTDYPDADVIIMLHRAGFRIGEVEVEMNQPQGRSKQHSGLKPLYYIFKMTLSIFVTLLRQNPRLTR